MIGVKTVLLIDNLNLRTLETKNRELETGSIRNNNRHSGDELVPML